MMKLALSWAFALTFISGACGVAEGPIEFKGDGSPPGLRSLDETDAGGAGGAAGAGAD